ncbi:MAG TPA: hypothetical protein DD381_13770 [Lentisphaeria bacterium]|nr:MAG: hypothetical protein A2X47_13755 [Lentisphaerae bacterium GWF2_38_69]HBM17390.1 hypothetical protein [Lentisphaeria bacterium]
MICKNCKTLNKSGSQHCINCGYELSAYSSGFSTKTIISAVIILLLLATALFYLFSHQSSKQKSVTAHTSSLQEQQSITERKVVTSAKDVSGFEKLKISFSDNTSNSLDIYISGRNLIAVPADMLKNIKSIICYDNIGQIEISDAYWDIDNPLVFLGFPIKSRQINPSINAYNISKWSSSAPLYSLTAETDIPEEISSFKIIEKKGDLLVISLESPFVDNNCILIQNNHLVGWEFTRDNKRTAYLWLGEEHSNPSEELKISTRLISMFFSEKRSLASSTMSLNSDELKEDLISCVKLLSSNNIKDQALLSKASGLILILSSRIKEIGLDKVLADELNPKLITALQNEEILKIYERATLNAYGYEKAIKQLNLIISMKSSSDSFNDKAYAFMAGLYEDWMESLLANNRPSDALGVYLAASKALPDEQKIKLLGIEIYIGLDNPEKALSIMNSTSFDSIYRPTLEKLRKLISDMIGKKNKIVIKFRPNPSNTILLDCVLNGSVRQKFIVDTGATLVSIPSETAKKLRIVPSATRLRAISTASGIFMAKEIIIESITINNQNVYNIPAVIIDLPDDRNLGLLGMSFLNRFNVELNSNSGELLLTPKEIN